MHGERRAFLRRRALHGQVDLLPFHLEADARLEGRGLKRRLRLLRLLQERLRAVALLGAATREKERGADDGGEEPDHGADVGTGRVDLHPSLGTFTEWTRR